MIKHSNYTIERNLRLIGLLTLTLFSLTIFMINSPILLDSVSSETRDPQSENRDNIFSMDIKEPSSSYSGYYDSLELPPITRIVLILVSFTDVAPTKTASALNDKIFGYMSSLKSYIQENSYGKCDIQGTYTTWLTLGHTEEYYGKNSTTGIDDFYGPSNKLFNDSIDLADSIIDFNQYDKIIIFHTGHPESEGISSDDVMSHSYQPTATPLLIRDGAGIYSASIVSELDTLGVICHEFGHQCGLPDLSDESGLGYNYLDDWCLMDKGYTLNGGSTPAHMTAFCKLFLGMMPSEKIKTIYDDEISYVHLDPFSAFGSNYQVVKLPLEDESEYYLIEFRNLTDYDAFIPDRGVIITFVNESKTSGHGIVNVMDSVPSTSSKNDGQFDVSTASNVNISVWNDLSNGIQVIVAGELTDNITVWINRRTIESYQNHDVNGWSSDDFSLGTLVVGQEVFWHWYTDDPDRDLNFYIENTGNSDEYERINEVISDAGVWKCSEAGTYQLILENEGVMSRNYALVYGTKTADNANFYSIDNSPATKYVVKNFTINTTIYNTGESTDEDIILSLELPSGITLANGETMNRLCSDLGYMDNYTAGWNLSASSTGSFNINVKINSKWQIERSQLEPISISVDSVDPTLMITGPSDNSWTTASFIQITWAGSDAESGIKEYRIYRNNVYLNTINAQTSTYSVTGLVTGSQTIKVSAIDNSNNDKNDTITVNRDSTIPVINEFSKEFVWITDNSLVDLQISCQDSGIGLGEFRIYKSISSGIWNQIYQDELSGASFIDEINVNVGSTGIATTVYFKLSVYDDIGNCVNSSLLTAFVDRIKPVLLGFQPSVAWMLNGFIPNFEVNCTDADSGLGRLELFRQFTVGTWIEIKEVSLTQGISEYNFAADIGEFTQASTRVKVIVYDMFNNSQESVAITIGNDNRAPILASYSLTDATPSNEKYSGVVHFKFTASDYGSGINQIEYDIINGSIHTSGSLVPASPFQYDLIFNSWGDGSGPLQYTISFNITMYDNVGNRSSFKFDYNINNIGYDPNQEIPTIIDPTTIGIIIGASLFGGLVVLMLIKRRSSSVRFTDDLYQKSKHEKKKEQQEKKKGFSKKLDELEFVSEKGPKSTDIQGPTEKPIKEESNQNLSKSIEDKSNSDTAQNQISDDDLFNNTETQDKAPNISKKTKEIKEDDLFKF